MPSNAPQQPLRTVVCPSCKGPSVFAPSNPQRPFCSPACRQHDLGAWASEAFKVPTLDGPTGTMEEPSAGPH